MGLESRALNKGTTMAGNSRKKPYGLLLLLALGAALLSIIVLHKLRERRVLGLLLEDRKRELLAFQLLVQKERVKTKQMKSRLDALRDKTISLSHQKTKLYNKLMETETAVIDLKRMKKEMETTLEEKENQINRITEKTSESIATNEQVSALTELLKQKEAEIEEMKHRLSEVQQPENITADDNVQNVTPLDLTKENENLQDSITSVDEGRVDSENETANSHEGNPKTGTWVKLETIIENEGLKDRSEGNNKLSAAEVAQDNQLKKIEDSQGSENLGKSGEMGQENSLEVAEHSEKLKDEEIVVGPSDSKRQGMESTSRELEGKEQWATEDGDSKKLESSQTSHEQSSSTELSAASAIEQPRMKHRRGRRTKRKSRRGQIVPRETELEKHDWEHNKISQEDENKVIRTETVDSMTVDTDRKEALTGSDQPKEQTTLPNDEILKITTSSRENEASKTMEIKENTAEDDTKGSTQISDDKTNIEHEAEGSFSSVSKIDVPRSISDGNSQNAESGGDVQEVKVESSTGGDHEGEEKEVISTDEKLVESEKPQNNDLAKPNDNDLQNHQKEITVNAT